MSQPHLIDVAPTGRTPSQVETALRRELAEARAAVRRHEVAARRLEVKAREIEAVAHTLADNFEAVLEFMGAALMARSGVSMSRR